MNKGAHVLDGLFGELLVGELGRRLHAILLLVVGEHGHAGRVRQQHFNFLILKWRKQS